MRQRGDGAMQAVKSVARSGKIQIHLTKGKPDKTFVNLRRFIRRHNLFAEYYRRTIRQRILPLIGFLKTYKCQGFFRARHSYIIKPALLVRVVTVFALIPVTIKHNHMVKLKPVSLVRSKQQKAPLAAAHLATPFGQPLNKVNH